MKSIPPIRTACALTALSLLAACVSAPTHAPKPAPVPTPAPPPAPEPVAKDWRDWPVAAGNWSYRTTAGGTIASFGQPGQPPLLSFRCDTAAKRISVARATTLPSDQINGQMIVRTSFGTAQWPVVAGGQGGASGTYAVAPRASNDAIFDQIAFSRGRFAIEAPGALPLAVPNWAEVSRVIEDCRG